MPQLDIYNIFSQLFWGSFFFISFYFFISLIVVPSIFSFLFSRVFFNSFNKAYYEVSFSTIFLSESVLFDSIFEPTIYKLNNALSNTVDFYTICESTVTDKSVLVG
jgi:hypothetical protein